jgi:hypothetical protein
LASTSSTTTQSVRTSHEGWSRPQVASRLSAEVVLSAASDSEACFTNTHVSPRQPDVINALHTRLTQVAWVQGCADPAGAHLL